MRYLRNLTYPGHSVIRLWNDDNPNNDEACNFHPSCDRINSDKTESNDNKNKRCAE